MSRTMRPRQRVRRRPRYLAPRPRRPMRQRPVAARGYPRRRGAGWIPGLLVILLLVGLAVLAWMFFSNNDGSTPAESPSAVSSAVSDAAVGAFSIGFVTTS